MTNTQEFSIDELQRLSQAASSPGGLEQINEGQTLDDARLAGTVRGFPLRKGLSLLYSELTAKSDFKLEGKIDASLNIIMSSGPDAYEIRLPGGNYQRFSGEQALLVSVTTTADLNGIYVAGRSNRAVRLRIFPDQLENETLAQLARDRIHPPRIERFPYFAELSSVVPMLAGPIGASYAGQLAAESLALDLLSRLLLLDTTTDIAGTEKLTSADRVKLFRVRDMVVADPARDHRLKELGAAAGIGVSALKAKFPMLFGQPVISFMRDVRLDNARKQLERDGITVSEAAHGAGYRHVSTFSTAFRRRFGAPPSRFRKNGRNPKSFG
ncbi:MAG: AraC family transcriptional regulator [Pseudomonadota bacterium]